MRRVTETFEEAAERQPADNEQERQEAALTYTLITPARNEADFIELTIKSVVAQTVRPLKWIIVSDGSTDGTDDIVSKRAAGHHWIELLRLPERKARDFCGKVQAFNAGWSRLKVLEYDLVGSLDADVSFGPDLFSFLLAKFATNPQLGVAGVPFREGGRGYDFRFSSVEHVSGACQLFRRQCFNDIGGYVPVKGGGIDVIAVLTARMKGWEARTYPARHYEHHRPMGSAKWGLLAKRFKDGEKDYYLGGHPVWELFRGMYQMCGRPFFLGGCVLLAGYFWSCLRRVERPISRELVDFRRRTQMQRLRRFLGHR